MVFKNSLKKQRPPQKNSPPWELPVGWRRPLSYRSFERNRLASFHMKESNSFSCFYGRARHATKYRKKYVEEVLSWNQIQFTEYAKAAQSGMDRDRRWEKFKLATKHSLERKKSAI